MIGLALVAGAAAQEEKPPSITVKGLEAGTVDFAVNGKTVASTTVTIDFDAFEELNIVVGGFVADVYLDRCSAGGITLNLVQRRERLRLLPLPDTGECRRVRLESNVKFDPGRHVVISTRRPIDPPGWSPGVGIGGGTFRSWIRTWEWTDDVEVFVVRSPRGEDKRTERPKLSDQQKTFGIDFDGWNTGATIVVPWPVIPGGESRPTGYLRPRLPRQRPLAAVSQAAATQVTGAPASGSRLRRFYPAVVFGAGRAGADFRYRNLQTGRVTTWTGDGLAWGLGVDGLFFLCADCAWFSAFTYEYQRLSDLDMVRSPTLNVAGGRLTRDEGSFTYRGHVVRGAVGYSFRRIAPWGGVRIAFQKAALDGNVEMDFSQSAGVPLTQQITFRNEFERTTTEALAGLDVRVPGTGLILRVEGSSDGDNSLMRFNVMYGFGR